MAFLKNPLLVACAVLVLVIVVAPPAAAKPIPPGECIQIYQEWDLGPITIVRAGCESRIERNGDPTDPCSWKPALC